MKYTVVWQPAALNELARLWNEAEDRQAITDAADEIDELLKWNPETRGESRSGAVRVLMVSPLVVVFEVQEMDRKVVVSAVGCTRKPN